MTIWNPRSYVRASMYTNVESIALEFAKKVLCRFINYTDAKSQMALVVGRYVRHCIT